MIQQATPAPHTQWQPGPDERTRLVGWCVHLTGDRFVAEDLAQEALLIAWRHERDLRDPGKRRSWLMGIARNLCKNWNRQQARDRITPAGLDVDQAAPGAVRDHVSVTDAGIDLELDLERQDLAVLLDRALALLPEETRDILIHRYIDESPHAEIAAQLGLSEGAVKVRVHRGRLALRRLLATDFREDAIAHGLNVSDKDAYRDTRIWCPCCGRHRLHGSFDSSRGNLVLQCPGCGDRPPGFRSINEGIERIKGLGSPGAALIQLLAGDPLRSALGGSAVTCRKCGSPNRVSMGPPPSVASSMDYPWAVHVACEECGATVDSILQGIALGLPETLRFWRSNPRMHVLPLREIVAGGSPAVVTTFASITGSERLDVVFSRAAFQVIGVHGETAR